jgi:hypothetical protein
MLMPLSSFISLSLFLTPSLSLTLSVCLSRSHVSSLSLSLSLSLLVEQQPPILGEQEPPQEVIICDHAGLVINKSSKGRKQRHKLLIHKQLFTHW